MNYSDLPKLLKTLAGLFERQNESPESTLGFHDFDLYSSASVKLCVAPSVSILLEMYLLGFIELIAYYFDKLKFIDHQHLQSP